VDRFASNYQVKRVDGDEATKLHPQLLEAKQFVAGSAGTGR
jgi:hypothetical protein